MHALHGPVAQSEGGLLTGNTPSDETNSAASSLQLCGRPVESFMQLVHGGGCTLHVVDGLAIPHRQQGRMTYVIGAGDRP